MSGAMHPGKFLRLARNQLIIRADVSKELPYGPGSSEICMYSCVPTSPIPSDGDMWALVSRNSIDPINLSAKDLVPSLTKFEGTYVVDAFLRHWNERSPQKLWIQDKPVVITHSGFSKGNWVMHFEVPTLSPILMLHFARLQTYLAYHSTIGDDKAELTQMFKRLSTFLSHQLYTLRAFMPF